MIIDNFYIFSTGIGPPKADPPLIVDSNAVLPGPLAPQSFEAIARRHSQVIESSGDFQLPQFAPRDRGDIHKTSDAKTF